MNKSTNSKNKLWSVLYDENSFESKSAIEEISSALGLSMTCAKILYNRGAKDASSAERYLSTGVEKLHSPFLLKDMDKAVERITAALEASEKITIYGDYDVDGVTSVTLLYLYLKSIGASVDYYIPSREGEGYGLSRGAIDTLATNGTSLIITVDTGITAKEETEYAKTLGIETVVTDHHECLSTLPEVCAVVNPHRPDCTYPFSELAGVGVVFKLVCALEISRHPELDSVVVLEKICNEYSDLAALGTVADVMPLCDENRAIVGMGLKRMSVEPRVGLAALIEASTNIANAKPVVSRTAVQKRRKIDAGYIGFGIAPRINAAGRISNATKAVELLLCENPVRAYDAAVELCEINILRQTEENKIAESAYQIVDNTHDFENDKIIVISGDHWHPGIIGIVASRVTEKYGLPAILISFDGAMGDEQSPSDIGKGSGRSIKGINLCDGLKACEDCLEKYGGHELAAGLSVRRDRIDEFKKKINQFARETLGDTELVERTYADCELSLADASMALADELTSLEPFGVSNPTPQFVMSDLTLQNVFPIGGGKHTKLILSDEVNSIQAVMFGIGGFDFKFFRNDRVDIICKLNINEFRGERTVQLVISDIRLSEKYQMEIEEGDEAYSEKTAGTLRAETSFALNRADVVSVYRFLKEIVIDSISYVELLRIINSESHKRISYIKLRLILDVLSEIKVLSVSDNGDGSIRIDVFSNATKTQLELSSTYREYSMSN